MKKILIITTILGLGYCQCLSEDFMQSSRVSYYEMGDTISLEHQLMQLDVCYGEYADSTFKIADSNYILNGGYYKVSMIRINATW